MTLKTPPSPKIPVLNYNMFPRWLLNTKKYKVDYLYKQMCDKDTARIAALGYSQWYRVAVASPSLSPCRVGVYIMHFPDSGAWQVVVVRYANDYRLPSIKKTAEVVASASAARSRNKRKRAKS